MVAFLAIQAYNRKIMRSVFIALLVLSFIGVAVFGLFPMISAEHGHDVCIAVASQRFNCQKVSDALPYIAFHLNAFRIFSTAVFGNNVANFVLLFFVSLLIVASGIGIGIYPALPTLSKYDNRRRFFGSFSPPFKLEFTRWLALLENSPTTLWAPI
ncbi:hypothetical protein A3H65_00675 [Candidatus Giovannonibacteria bacterium RIFCSPLOWO2_02_FULL_45_14]|uniref:Uncharacterized protein n=1 Tax=Candidatus Giovannonibacteria bacterium RIFCSPLOWO2_12_FULL_44_15 TaxID=1798364 RepID=A0A1F5Y0M6_9BACT|nr:MAG: hypothetical protein A3H65_00675 [Candidatus Giovannonibacteria bacterium RIFCSPLOWO2_02_FULL_45_14]OGF93725.1 MAG: hypothetical protein A3G54_02165 [Candidatus Giovannonibacteria bacterium RIFCSPLOWO2_12_FULL_44_15]